MQMQVNNAGAGGGVLVNALHAPLNPNMPAVRMYGAHLLPLPNETITSEGLDMHRCWACSTGPDDVDLSKQRGQNITDVTAHDRLPKHIDRHSAGRHLQPRGVAHVDVPNGHYQRLPNAAKHRCNVCSLNGNGTVRARNSKIADDTIGAHMAGADHQRRCQDGRYALWYAAGVPRL
jgi:hypothetical protein